MVLQFLFLLKQLKATYKLNIRFSFFVCYHRLRYASFAICAFIYHVLEASEATTLGVKTRDGH